MGGLVRSDTDVLLCPGPIVHRCFVEQAACSAEVWLDVLSDTQAAIRQANHGESLGLDGTDELYANTGNLRSVSIDAINIMMVCHVSQVYPCD